MAHGSIASVCAGRISMVPALDAPVRAISLDGADHHLDSQHHPDLLRLAFACAGSSMGGSWLDYAAGIRIRGDCRCHYPVSPVRATGGSVTLNGQVPLEMRSANLCDTCAVQFVAPPG